MARIRTIKPELFRHFDLHKAETETGLPLRLSFAALFCCCDREGRFKWQPEQLKLDCLPFDVIDFSRVLDALLTRDFLVKYEGPDRKIYGCIPTWKKHQFVNAKEGASSIPSLEESIVCQRVDDASVTREVRVDENGVKEGERKGKGKEGERKDFPAALSLVAPEKNKAGTSETWQAYSKAYEIRYGVPPVRNAGVNSKIKQFVQKVGMDEAPAIATYFVAHNSSFYIGRGHAVGNMLADAEKLRTEWATGNSITQTKARQMDKTASNPFLQILSEMKNEQS